MLKYKQIESQSMLILTFEFSKICFEVFKTSDALLTNTEFGKLFLLIPKKTPFEMS